MWLHEATPDDARAAGDARGGEKEGDDVAGDVGSRGVLEGGPSEAVAREGGGAVSEQRVHDVVVAELRRPHHSRAAVSVGRVDVGGVRLREEREHARAVAPSRRAVQRG